MATPEAQSRIQIDRQLEAASWVVQDYQQINLTAGLGVAVREFQLSTGAVDYMLFVDGRAAGVLEAKAVGATLMGVTTQSEKYQVGTHPALQTTWGSPLPFAYESTSVETQFRDERDPEGDYIPVYPSPQRALLPRYRQVFLGGPRMIAFATFSGVSGMGVGIVSLTGRPRFLS